LSADRLTSADFGDPRAREALREVLGRIIGPESRFVWEIGSGHGHFLAAYAKDPSGEGVRRHRHRLRPGRAGRSQARRALLGNLHFIRADAEDFLASMPDGARFTAVFILFPDPWPKRRHHKNRVMTPQFLSDVAAKSVKGASLHFRTDHEPYFREARCDPRIGYKIVMGRRSPIGSEREGLDIDSGRGAFPGAEAAAHR
jgi:tRNA (guanine-N7-)-methyltransferase